MMPTRRASAFWSRPATRIINHPSEVSSWLELVAGHAPPDDDCDGMADAWEKKHGFNPTDVANSNGDPDGDGYINIEEFLNGTDPNSP